MRILPLLILLSIVVPSSPSFAAGLRLMTYNLNYGNPRPQTSLDAIAQADPDIVLLQEITIPWKQALEQRFAKQYPHRAYRAGSVGGLAVLSKVPISAEELWPAPTGTGAWFPAQRLVVSSPLGAVQLLHVHLRPANMDGSWVKGFFKTPPLRRKEIEAHWKRLDARLPTIIAGDFNEDPWGQAITYLEQRGLARVPTAGPTTWHYETVENGKASDLLKLDIDHVMIDPRLAARDGRVLDAGTSDHRPVVVTLEPKPKP